MIEQADSDIALDLADLFQQAPTFMCMLEGPAHRVQMVNPAFERLIGQRRIVGASFGSALPDAAAQGYVGLLDDVYRSATPFAANGALFAVQPAPGGPVSERFVDLVFQPITSAGGEVRGIFMHGADVTERVHAEHRRDALIELTDALRDLKTPDDISYRACEILGRALGVSRVGYGAIDAANEVLSVERDWTAAGIPTLDRTQSLRGYGAFIDELKLGLCVAVDDVDLDTRTASAAAHLRARGAASFVIVPLIEAGRLVAVMFVNHALPRAWRADDLALTREAAERARTAGERQRSELAMRASEAKFRTIAEAMPHMLWSTLADGTYDYFNQRWFEFTGVPDDAPPGEEAWESILHPDDQAATRARWRRSLDTGATYEDQYRMRHHSGEYRWVLDRALPVRGEHGEIIRWMGSCTDIQVQKLAEVELREVNRRKDEFLAMLAHELRNPLAPISTAAQLLKIGNIDERRIQQASDIIVRQVRHMTDLVDDLLDVSRVTRGLVQLDKVALDLKSIVAAAVEQARPLIEARRHELVLRMPSARTCVRGDKTRLVQVVANLLNNAAKYTPQGGEITLALEVRETQVAIVVRDNGSGIAPGLLPSVFNLFTQGERTPDRAQGGLGLGLALVKSITQLHDGEASAASEGSGKGSTFTIALPLLQSEPALHAGQRRAGRAARSGAAVRLMIVDDNVDAARSLAALLEADGHMAEVAEDARGALGFAALDAIQVFILDIGLPDMDGYELARRLRADPATRGALLIALTGYGQGHDRVLSKAAGFDHHFVKPVDTEVLTQLFAALG